MNEYDAKMMRSGYYLNITESCLVQIDSSLDVCVSFNFVRVWIRSGKIRRLRNRIDPSLIIVIFHLSHRAQEETNENSTLLRAYL